VSAANLPQTLTARAAVVNASDLVGLRSVPPVTRPGEGAGDGPGAERVIVLADGPAGVVVVEAAKQAASDLGVDVVAYVDRAQIGDGRRKGHAWMVFSADGSRPKPAVTDPGPLTTTTTSTSAPTQTTTPGPAPDVAPPVPPKTGQITATALGGPSVAPSDTVSPPKLNERIREAAEAWVKWSGKQVASSSSSLSGGLRKEAVDALRHRGLQVHQIPRDDDGQPLPLTEWDYNTQAAAALSNFLRDDPHADADAIAQDLARGHPRDVIMPAGASRANNPSGESSRTFSAPGESSRGHFLQYQDLVDRAQEESKKGVANADEFLTELRRDDDGRFNPNDARDAWGVVFRRKNRRVAAYEVPIPKYDLSTQQLAQWMVTAWRQTDRNLAYSSALNGQQMPWKRLRELARQIYGEKTSLFKGGLFDRPAEWSKVQEWKNLRTAVEALGTRGAALVIVGRPGMPDQVIAVMNTAEGMKIVNLDGDIKNINNSIVDADETPPISLRKALRERAEVRTLLVASDGIGFIWTEPKDDAIFGAGEASRAVSAGREDSIDSESGRQPIAGELGDRERAAKVAERLLNSALEKRGVFSGEMPAEMVAEFAELVNKFTDSLLNTLDGHGSPLLYALLPETDLGDMDAVHSLIASLINEKFPSQATEVATHLVRNGSAEPADGAPVADSTGRWVAAGSAGRRNPLDAVSSQGARGARQLSPDLNSAGRARPAATDAGAITITPHALMPRVVMARKHVDQRPVGATSRERTPSEKRSEQLRELARLLYGTEDSLLERPGDWPEVKHWHSLLTLVNEVRGTALAIVGDPHNIQLAIAVVNTTEGLTVVNLNDGTSHETENVPPSYLQYAFGRTTEQTDGVGEEQAAERGRTGAVVRALLVGLDGKPVRREPDTAAEAPTPVPERGSSPLPHGDPPPYEAMPGVRAERATTALPYSVWASSLRNVREAAETQIAAEAALPAEVKWAKAVQVAAYLLRTLLDEKGVASGEVPAAVVSEVAEDLLKTSNFRPLLLSTDLHAEILKSPDVINMALLTAMELINERGEWRGRGPRADVDHIMVDVGPRIEWDFSDVKYGGAKYPLQYVLMLRLKSLRASNKFIDTPWVERVKSAQEYFEVQDREFSDPPDVLVFENVVHNNSVEDEMLPYIKAGLKSLGMEAVSMTPDGDCFFHTLLSEQTPERVRRRIQQVIGDHPTVERIRNHMADFVDDAFKHGDFVANFFEVYDDEDRRDHVEDIRRMGSYDNDASDVVPQLFSHIFGVPMWIWEDSSRLPIGWSHDDPDPVVPLVVVRHRVHYWAAGTRNRMEPTLTSPAKYPGPRVRPHLRPLPVTSASPQPGPVPSASTGPRPLPSVPGGQMASRFNTGPGSESVRPPVAPQPRTRTERNGETGAGRGDVVPPTTRSRPLPSVLGGQTASRADTGPGSENVRPPVAPQARTGTEGNGETSAGRGDLVPPLQPRRRRPMPPATASRSETEPSEGAPTRSRTDSSGRLLGSAREDDPVALRWPAGHRITINPAPRVRAQLDTAPSGSGDVSREWAFRVRSHEDVEEFYKRIGGPQGEHLWTVTQHDPDVELRPAPDTRSDPAVWILERRFDAISVAAGVGENSSLEASRAKFSYKVTATGAIELPDGARISGDGWLKHGVDFFNTDDQQRLVVLRGDSGWVGLVDNADILRPALEDWYREAKPARYQTQIHNKALYLTSDGEKPVLAGPLPKQIDNGGIWQNSSLSRQDCVNVAVIWRD
jgi:hypothetical protein